MATPAPSSSNQDSGQLLEPSWTQEYVNGLKRKYRRMIYGFLFSTLILFVAFYIDVLLFMEAEGLWESLLKDWEDLKSGSFWGGFLPTLVVGLPFLYYTYRLSRFRFLCPNTDCEKWVVMAEPWECPYCDDTTGFFASALGFSVLTRCRHFPCRQSPPAVECPKCGFIIPLKFRAGKRKYARFLNSSTATPPPPQPPREEPPFP